MGKIGCLLFCLLCSYSLYGQTGFFDYANNQEFTHYGTTYKVWNPADRFMRQLYDSEKEVRVGLESISNFRFDHLGEYANGTYTDSSEDIENIILPSSNYQPILFHAMRNVFTLEELERNPKLVIFIYVVVDKGGCILESASGFPISKSYIIQPQQIAALETMIRKNLTFVLDQEKAAKFNYFQGEVWLRFGNFIEAPPSLPQNAGHFIEGEEVERTKPLYTINLVEEFLNFSIANSDGAPIYDRIGGTLLP